MTDFSLQTINDILFEVETETNKGFFYIDIIFPRVLTDEECDCLADYLRRLNYTILEMSTIGMYIYH